LNGPGLADIRKARSLVPVKTGEDLQSIGALVCGTISQDAHLLLDDIRDVNSPSAGHLLAELQCRGYSPALLALFLQGLCTLVEFAGGICRWNFGGILGQFWVLMTQPFSALRGSAELETRIAKNSLDNGNIVLSSL